MFNIIKTYSILSVEARISNISIMYSYLNIRSKLSPYLLQLTEITNVLSKIYDILQIQISYTYHIQRET